ncbi:MAG: hypothetical protein K0V04_44275 [Deltaproteobacteria bacterium]|nr:hypothetical protein [Deltaproteobacteria bacterium]
MIGAALSLAGCPGDDTSGTAGGSSDGGTTSGTTETTPPVADSTTASPPDDTSTTGMATGSTTSGGSSSGSDSGSDSGSSDGGTTTGGMELCEVMLPPPPMCPGPGAGPGPGAQFECDPIAQDCPAGEKCMPWANDGGGSWNATRCTNIAPNPGQVGDVCTVEGSGVSGIDDCDIGAMCFGVDPATNMGECIELCGCSYDNPSCQDAASVCSISNDNSLTICTPVCNPLDPMACEAGQGCYPVGGFFQCAPDASGGQGAAGDPCEFINVCQPGTVCLNAASVPNCQGAAGCCASACDIDDPNPGCPAGTNCLPWFEEGSAPDECLGTVGVCATPA